MKVISFLTKPAGVSDMGAIVELLMPGGGKTYATAEQAELAAFRAAVERELGSASVIRDAVQSTVAYREASARLRGLNLEVAAVQREIAAIAADTYDPVKLRERRLLLQKADALNRSHAEAIETEAVCRHLASTPRKAAEKAIQKMIADRRAKLAPEADRLKKQLGDSMKADELLATLGRLQSLNDGIINALFERLVEKCIETPAGKPTPELVPA